MNNAQARRNALLAAYAKGNTARVWRLAKKLGMYTGPGATIQHVTNAAGLFHDKKGEWKL